MKTKRTQDAYDRAVTYLKERPDEIPTAWVEATSHPAGMLFAFANREKMAGGHDAHGQPFGCPTMIRSGQYGAATLKVRDAIRRRRSIPDDPDDIRVEHLPAFASVQRMVDKALRRRKPKWVGAKA